MRTIPILRYQSIATTTSRRFRPFVVTPDTFARQMRFLRHQGYTTLTIAQLCALMAQDEAALPKSPVVLTFDGGFADFYHEALPTIIQHDFTATVYIVTKYIGGVSEWLVGANAQDRPILTWSQIVAMRDLGIECGSLSHTHAQLDRLPLLQVYRELHTSKSLLEDRLGEPVNSLAYPSGYQTNATRVCAHAVGYRTACGVANEPTTTRDLPLALKRLDITAATTLADFDRMLHLEPSMPRKVLHHVQTRVWRMARQIVNAPQTPATPECEDPCFPSAHDVSVVIGVVATDRLDDIRTAIASARNQTVAPREVLVVVNAGSCLASKLNCMTAAMPEVQVIEQQQGQGRAAAWYLGASLAQGEYVAFLDGLANAEPDWLEWMCHWFADPTIAGVGGRVMPQWADLSPAWFPEEFSSMIGCSDQSMPMAPVAVDTDAVIFPCLRRKHFTYAGVALTDTQHTHAQRGSDEQSEFGMGIAQRQPIGTLIFEPRAVVRRTIAPGEITWRAFLARCFRAGYSRAQAPRDHATWRHVTSSTPQSVANGLMDALLWRDPTGFARAAIAVVGCVATLAGYGVANWSPTASALVGQTPERRGERVQIG